MKEREAAGSVLMDTIVDEGSPNQNPCHVQEVICPVTKVSCNLVCGALIYIFEAGMCMHLCTGTDRYDSFFNPYIEL